MGNFIVHNKKCGSALSFETMLKTMKKNMTDFRVVENLSLTDRLFLLKLTPADGSPIGDTRPGQFVEVRVILIQRLLLGAFYGLAQMVLASTLIIDTSESYMRTEANHSAGWFSRFAIAIGPMMGILLYRYHGFDAVLLASMCCSLASGVFILTVTFFIKHYHISAFVFY